MPTNITIRFILHYPAVLDAGILCEATKAVIDSVDVLHASFVPKNRVSHWRIHTDYTVADYFSLAECDGKYLLNKLAESYRLIEQSGNANALEVKNGSRSAVNAYSELGVKDLASLAKAPFRGVKTEYPFADPKAHGPLRMLRCTIPADVLGQARKRARIDGATVNDLLLTACYRAYAKNTGREGAMSVSAMMDLRNHCKDGISTGLANMSGGLSTSLEI